MTKTTMKTTKQKMNAPLILLPNNENVLLFWESGGWGTKLGADFGFKSKQRNFWEIKKISCKIGRKRIAVQTGKKQEIGALRFQRIQKKHGRQTENTWQIMWMHNARKILSRYYRNTNRFSRSWS
jgi:hypothetical protein